MNPENRIAIVLNTASVAIIGKNPSAGIFVSLEQEIITICLAVEWVQASQTVALVVAN
jgi:hypothetical protein